MLAAARLRLSRAKASGRDVCHSLKENPRRGIVVGADGSPAAGAAVTFAAEKAAAAGAALEFLCCTGEIPIPDKGLARNREAADEIAREALAVVETARPELDVVARVVEGSAERKLVDASTDAALVVVGSRGRGAFRAMVAGSTACALIHGAICPVAVVGDVVP